MRRLRRDSPPEQWTATSRGHAAHIGALLGGQDGGEGGLPASAVAAAPSLNDKGKDSLLRR